MFVYNYFYDNVCTYNKKRYWNVINNLFCCMAVSKWMQRQWGGGYLDRCCEYLAQPESLTICIYIYNFRTTTATLPAPTNMTSCEFDFVIPMSSSYYSPVYNSILHIIHLCSSNSLPHINLCLSNSLSHIIHLCFSNLLPHIIHLCLILFFKWFLGLPFLLSCAFKR